MAHMCMNWVRFSGEEADVEKFISEIKRLSSLCTCSNGVFAGNNGYAMFDIEASEIDKEKAFAFQSKWSPALGALSYLSETFRVAIECDYEESGSYEYGTWQCDTEANVISHVSLTENEIALVTPYGDIYQYNGESYECKTDAYDVILEQKKLQTA